MILCKLASTMQTIPNNYIFSGRFRERFTRIVHQAKRKKHIPTYEQTVSFCGKDTVIEQFVKTILSSPRNDFAKNMSEEKSTTHQGLISAESVSLHKFPPSPPEY